MIEELMKKAISFLGVSEPTGDDQFIQYYNNLTRAGFNMAVAWCAIFVTVVARMVGIPTSIIPTFASCDIGANWFRNKGRYEKGKYYGGHDEREQTLNQLLVEMDGFSDNEGVIILAATNRPDVLDKALLRAGRFDRQIVVGAPDVKAREQILEVHSRKKRLANDVDLKVIAKNTSGFAGADLENILNEAALLSARRNLPEIGMKEIEDAMVKVTMGPEKRTRVRSEKENKLVAYHEAGHAVVSRYLPTQDPVHQISIVPRGMAGGYTMYRPTEDKNFMSKSEMEETIVSLLGGRVAEKLILDDISTGATRL